MPREPTLKQKQAAEAAFHKAIGTIKGKAKLADFSPTIDLLEPRLTEQKYQVIAFKTGFNHTWHGQVAEKMSRGEHAGAVLATLSPKAIVGEDCHAFERTALHTDARTVMFDPKEINLDADLRENITSFAKLILHYRGGKPILLLTTLQKVTAWSATKQRQVDKREGKEGVDRHFIHIALAEKVAREMKKRGVEVELHVPAARHIRAQIRCAI